VTRDRIEALRAAMQRHGLAAWVVPSSDPHLSEYLPARWQGRQWASGFTGSVGTLVVTPRFAGLWVDSRYWLQAETELAGSGIVTMKINGQVASSRLSLSRTASGRSSASMAACSAFRQCACCRMRGRTRRGAATGPGPARGDLARAARPAG
jgi:hypothetical protein